jgi:hypothetical protein
MLVSTLYLALRRWASLDAAGEWGDPEVFKQFAVVQVIPALLAGIIGMSVWSPFGEPERMSAMSLARLRSIYLTLLVSVASCMSWWFLAGWAARQEDIDLTVVALRNLFGMTGMALLAGRFLDARLTWLAPVCWSILATMMAIRLGSGNTWELAAWVWTGQPQSNATSWLAATTLFLIGVAAFLRWGTKDTATET